MSQKENQPVWFVKKREVPTKFKNKRFAGQVMIMAFWDCCGLVYTEFGPVAHNEKQN